MSEKKNGSINSTFDESLEKLVKVIDSISYGSVTAVIQEGKIVQIEKNEKVRLK
ncbi:hypothetical protein CLPU_6c01250 [Gottschalkia purinilytica]|uniref:DUF2292 domain-containing protein n=1 Tax=Gottschalkia purinilytica TaxID=1503 RepID=A0A0L0WAT7_GOTPU|nr:YezD family protein [Gottschalkia purinilytica]KNF08639.1 hypothetical protein CLPU_6c01250 [Gottschalkia purinilytica]